MENYGIGPAYTASKEHKRQNGGIYTLSLPWNGELMLLKIFAVGTFCAVRYSDYRQGFEPA